MLPLVGTGCADSSSPTASAADVRGGRSEQFELIIAIAPALLILGRPGDCVTVHAEIPYGEVDHATLALSGVSPYVVKPDNRGDLVAKFARTSIESTVSPPEATLTLTGLILTGYPFAGSDSIQVR